MSEIGKTETKENKSKKSNKLKVEKNLFLKHIFVHVASRDLEFKRATFTQFFEAHRHRADRNAQRLAEFF